MNKSAVECCHPDGIIRRGEGENAIKSETRHELHIEARLNIPMEMDPAPVSL